MFQSSTIADGSSQWTDLNETVELEHGSEETSQYESE